MEACPPRRGRDVLQGSPEGLLRPRRSHCGDHQWNGSAELPGAEAITRGAVRTLIAIRAAAHNAVAHESESDRAEAVFENGILTLTLPKSEKVKPKSIKVNVRGVIEGKK
mgnify:CR=1 FL=1